MSCLACHCRDSAACTYTSDFWIYLEVSHFGSVIALNSSISISLDVVIVAASGHQEQLGLCNRTSLLYCGSYGGLCASRSAQLSRNQGSPCASGCAKVATEPVINPRTQNPTPITLHVCLAYTGEGKQLKRSQLRPYRMLLNIRQHPCEI
jgi:hypothetical protein